MVGGMSCGSHISHSFPLHMAVGLAKLLTVFGACIYVGMVDAESVTVANPSFESYSLNDTSVANLQLGYVDPGIGSAPVPGWTIGDGGVWLYYNITNNTIPDGNVALLLANKGPGSISQRLNLTAGQMYDLSYTTVGAGFGCYGKTTYQVNAGSTTKTLTFTPSSSDSSGDYWMAGFSFLGDAEGVLTFKTTNLSEPNDKTFCAVVLDAITVRVRPAVVPPTGDLVANGGFEDAPSFPAGSLTTHGRYKYIQLFGLAPVAGWGVARPYGLWMLRNTDSLDALVGSYSLGFTKYGVGISQAISTTVGRRYRLSFNASGYFDCVERFSITAYLGSQSQRSPLLSSDRNLFFSFDADVFSSITTLFIVGKTDSETTTTGFLCGPLIDEISVVEIGNATLVPPQAMPPGNFTGQAEEVDFGMENFTTNGSEMVFLGSTKMEQDGTGGKTLRLTTNTVAESGRALFGNPFRLFDRASGRVASFDTNFTMKMTKYASAALAGGQGLAFILVPDKTETGVPGGGMGFEYPASSGLRTPTFGVEFDTFQDMSYGDINGDFENAWAENVAHHVGLNVDSAVSIAAANLYATTAPRYLNDGSLLNSRISFDNTTQTVRVWLSESALGSDTSPVLTATVDLQSLLNPAEWFYIGFSASTDLYLQSHEIHAWQFRSSIPSSQGFRVMSPPAPSQSPPSTATGKSNGSKVGIIGGAIAVALVFLGVCACAIAAWCIRRRKEGGVSRGLMAAPGEVRKSSSEALGIPMGPRPFTFEELRKATDGFSTHLGVGGQGTVYMGTLPDKAVVAVKVIDIERNVKGGERAFRAEASTLGSLRHRNLCRLVGWCVDYDRAKLVCCYEYMENGSLDRWLFLPRQWNGEATHPLKSPLTWPVRYNIGIGLARALAYLHEEAEDKVVHRDVKPGNIMLDESFNTRLGDFGLAFSVRHDATSIESRTMAGTAVYMPPEARLGLKASEKWDVYAFGVVALELVSGRRAMEMTYPANEVVLLMYVWQLVEEGRPLDLADKKLEGVFDEVEAWKLIQLALACTSPNPQLRPSMRQVTQALDTEGGSIFPVEVPTTRPGELVVPDYISNASSSWSATRISGEKYNSDKDGKSESGNRE